GQGADEVGSIAQSLGEARRWISFVAPRHIVATVETLFEIEAGAESTSLSGNHNDFDLWIIGQLPDTGLPFGQDLGCHRIHCFWTIKRCGANTVGNGHFDGHGTPLGEFAVWRFMLRGGVLGLLFGGGFALLPTRAGARDPARVRSRGLRRQGTRAGTGKRIARTRHRAWSDPHGEGSRSSGRAPR